MNLTVEQCERGRARYRHLNFLRYCWQSDKPLYVGAHTRGICEAIDNAIYKFRNGESSYLAIRVPFRHGKSDLVSRYLVPHFLGEYPNEEIILSTYGASLAYTFSKFSRGLVQSDEYQRLYPGLTLDRSDRSVEEWSLGGHMGGVHYTGLGGSITGKGGSLLILDDFLKSREDAESEIMRNKLWESFTSDFLTRAAPVCIVIVLATPWHVDDVFGRIERHMSEDPAFPRFEFQTYPAFSDEYESGYLFPERFTPEWYEAQKATLGTYGTASLLQCSPTVRSGGILRTDKVKTIPEMPDGIRWVRAWDLASSTKQRIKDDPDYTVGVKLGVRWEKTAVAGEKLPIVFIDDVVRGRWEAQQRNEVIVSTAQADGPEVRVGIEAFAGYKDAYTELKAMLAGVRSVSKAQLPGDKVAKASRLEPAFEAGNVYLKQAKWNGEFLSECVDFPGGRHDDQVDAMTVAFWMCRRSAIATSGRLAI